jgi:hypothetical protein
MSIENSKPFEGKTCFVITPIGGDGTAIRREADGIVDEVLIPVLSGQLGFDVKVAHRIEVTGSISQQVIREVMESDLAICNLTTLNPNVMYELALRHAARLPVVTIASDTTKLPFDIAEDRVIFYQNDFMGAHKLKDSLRPMIINCMKDDNPDNPVYRSITASKVIKEVHLSGGSEAAIFDALDRLNQRMSTLQLGSTSHVISQSPISSDSLELTIEDHSQDHNPSVTEDIIMGVVAEVFEFKIDSIDVKKSILKNIYKAKLTFPSDISNESKIEIQSLEVALHSYGFKLLHNQNLMLTTG